MRLVQCTIDVILPICSSSSFTVSVSAPIHAPLAAPCSGVAASHDEDSRPMEGSEPVPGLPIYKGFECTVDHQQCRHLSISKAAIRRHCRTAHFVRSSNTRRPKSRGAGGAAQILGCRCARLQTLFHHEYARTLGHLTWPSIRAQPLPAFCHFSTSSIRN